MRNWILVLCLCFCLIDCAEQHNCLTEKDVRKICEEVNQEMIIATLIDYDISKSKGNIFKTKHKIDIKVGWCGFGDYQKTKCIVLKHTTFDVDRTELLDIIKREGGEIQGCDFAGVYWLVKGDEKEFIKRIKPKIAWWLKYRY